MTVWRISEHAELDGAGGLSNSARWHTSGQRIVYSATNPSTSLLEVLVHVEVELEDLPEELQYLEIVAHDSVSLKTIDVDALGQNWQNDLDVTQRAGDEWLQAGRTALLRVPSVIVPATWNVLINPRHPDSKQIRVARIHRHATDPRLLR